MPLDLPAPPEPALGERRCWYCGTTDAAVYEREHQLPISRGGVPSSQTVDSCQFHNRLKGDRTVEEFRAEIAGVLGVDPIQREDEAAIARYAFKLALEAFGQAFKRGRVSEPGEEGRRHRTPFQVRKI